MSMIQELVLVFTGGKNTPLDTHNCSGARRPLKILYLHTMIEIGKTASLTMRRTNPGGYQFSDDEGQLVLLPLSQTEKTYRPGDRQELFVYSDSNGQLLASERRPYALLGDFAYLRVTDVQEFGAFLDWGLEKDLFVPAPAQEKPMQVNEFYVVYIYLDEKTGRLAASSRLDKFVSKDVAALREGEEVDVLVFAESGLGYSAIVNNRFKGLIYRNEVFRDLEVGDELKAHVKLIRPDQLIDLSLQQSGFKHVLSSTEEVLQKLKENNGYLNLHDKSSPDEIARRLNMSKATFKKAIGILYRQRQIVIEDNGIRWVENAPRTDA